MNLSIDIETFSSVDLKQEGLYKYAESDDFEILLFAYKLGDLPVEVVDIASGEEIPPNILEALYDSQIIKSAYNASFEMICINKYLESINKPTIPPEQWEDTMFLSSYAGYGGSLKTTAELLDLPVEAQKDRTGTQLINRFSKPRKPTAKDKRKRIKPQDDPLAWAKFIEYNRQDVVVEATIREKLKKIQIPLKERKAFLLDHKIMSSGVLIDTELVQAALDLDAAEKKRLKDEITVLSGVENPKSNVQITKWLSSQLGYEVKSIRKESVPELIKECENNNLFEAATVLKLRQEFNKTSLAKYKSLKRMVCKDNRIKGMLQFYGSRTGRWAGRGVQVQNLPRNYISSISCARELLRSRNFEGLRLIYGSNLSDIASQLIRTVFIPTPGKTFAVADYSAIEARVIAWLSGEEWRIQAFKNNQDIYCVSASQMFDVPLEKILDKKSPEHNLRAQGKVAELALGYQGGANAMARMDFNNVIPEDDRPKIVKQWRDKSQKIVDLWKKCETAAINAIEKPDTEFEVNNKVSFKSVENTLIVTLPSKRKLYYPKAKLGINPFGKASFEYEGLSQTSHKVEVIYMYGGKMVENIVQAIARDCLSETSLRLDQAGFEIKFHIHDEAILEVDSDKADAELERAISIMCEEPEWAQGLPLNAAGFTSDFYMKD